MIRYLHAAVAAFAATWLFVVQPLQAQLLLPEVGGTPLAWAVVTAFFQLALLIGYLLAHVTLLALGPRWQRWLLVALLVVSARFGPTAVHVAPTSGTTRALLWGLIAALGLPVVSLACLSPSVQRWFAVDRGDDDPYWLYAASNGGSLVALVSYPLILQPALRLGEQVTAWRVGMLVLALLVGLTASRTAGAGHAFPPARAASTSADAAARLRWVVLSAVPSALVLAATNHITTDLAPTPALWTLPLAIYLLSWVVAFSPGRLAPLGPALCRLAPLIVLPLVPLIALGTAAPIGLVMTLHLVAMGALCLALHHRLHALRPSQDQLTSYYGHIALGGAVGGSLVAFTCPAVFPGPWEYPLLLGTALLLVGRHAEATPDAALGWRTSLPLAVVLAVALVGVHTRDPLTGLEIPYAPFAVLLFALVPSPRWPAIAARAVAIFLLATYFGVAASRPVIERTRSPFGSYRVADDSRRGFRYLAHGHIIHGAQSLDPTQRDLALPYWPPGSPAAQVFDRVMAPRDLGEPSAPGAPGRSRRPRVAVLGLGVGALAGLVEGDADVVFWEIDPQVVRLARAHFDFLDRCGDRCSVVVGDGRLGLQAREGRFDLIVLDAFSSSAVPTHLLTKEAFETYLDRLAPGGAILVHVTNRHVDLEPLLASTADALELDARHRAFTPTDATRQVHPFVAASRWVILTRGSAQLDRYIDTSVWQRAARRPGLRPWHDDRVRVLDVLGGPSPASSAQD